MGISTTHQLIIGLVLLCFAIEKGKKQKLRFLTASLLMDDCYKWKTAASVSCQNKYTDKIQRLYVCFMQISRTTAAYLSPFTANLIAGDGCETIPPISAVINDV